MGKLKFVGIKMPEDLKKACQREAKRESRSLSAFIKVVLETYLQKRKLKNRKG